ncbi:Uncharacterised protein [Mycobacteroides abscessus]|nr:Uncharacterised protein [Mycobacteroides abscessus]
MHDPIGLQEVFGDGEAGGYAIGRQRGVFDPTSLSKGAVGILLNCSGVSGI